MNFFYWKSCNNSSEQQLHTKNCDSTSINSSINIIIIDNFSCSYICSSNNSNSNNNDQRSSSGNKKKYFSSSVLFTLACGDRPPPWPRVSFRVRPPGLLRRRPGPPGPSLLRLRLIRSGRRGLLFGAGGSTQEQAGPGRRRRAGPRRRRRRHLGRDSDSANALLPHLLPGGAAVSLRYLREFIVKNCIFLKDKTG